MEVEGPEVEVSVTTDTPAAETPTQKPEVIKEKATAPVETAKGEDVWHTVVDGDLVGRIAQKYGTTTAEIRRLNPDINIDRISIGQRIKVKGSPKVAAVTPESNVAPAANSEEVWYTVVDGDLVGRIAQRYGTTSAKIAELNPDINIDRISIGQRIRVK